MVRRWVAVLGILMGPGVGAADEAPGEQRVLVKRAGVRFGYVAGEKWVDLGEVTELIVTVLERREGWALVRSGGKRGWLRAADVVPLADAPAFFTGMIEAQPRIGAHYLRRAVARAERGEYDKAIGDYTEAIRLDPNNPAGYYGRAVARHLNRAYGGAQEDYTEAIRLAPGHAGAHAGRAWLRATCPEGRYRDGDGAVHDARRACELTGWNDPDCIDNLAAACAETGQFDEAVRWQSRALEFPTFSGRRRENALARVKLYREHQPYRTARGD
ncbi:MAG: tetratricopeptide repeat protein [Planctomycetes bacterium]|nr:tetratricopeptide repeat protein [Planctomycetota bacterium]